MLRWVRKVAERLASLTAWSACPWGLRMLMTSSPTWIRPWPLSKRWFCDDVFAKQEHGGTDGAQHRLQLTHQLWKHPNLCLENGSPATTIVFLIRNMHGDSKFSGDFKLFLCSAASTSWMRVAVAVE